MEEITYSTAQKTSLPPSSWFVLTLKEFIHCRIQQQCYTHINNLGRGDKTNCMQF